MAFRVALAPHVAVETRAYAPPRRWTLINVRRVPLSGKVSRQSGGCGNVSKHAILERLEYLVYQQHEARSL